MFREKHVAINSYIKIRFQISSLILQLQKLKRVMEGRAGSASLPAFAENLASVPSTQMAAQHHL